MGAAQDFERDGFVIFRSVFAPQEIEKMRECCLEALRRSREQGVLERIDDPSLRVQRILPDLLSNPELEPVDFVVLDRRIVECAKELVGDPLIYFSDSMIHFGEGNRGFHKDCAHRNDPAGSDWQSSYTVIRMGVYLQDHAEHSGGLKVRIGSHKETNRFVGKSINLETRAGDVVFWKLTTSHSGNTVRLRPMPSLSLIPRLETRVPRWLRVPEDKERIAVFSAFGTADVHLDTYIKYLGTRTDAAEIFPLCYHSEAAVKLAKERGVLLRQPTQNFAQKAKFPTQLTV